MVKFGNVLTVVTPKAQASFAMSSRGFFGSIVVGGGGAVVFVIMVRESFGGAVVGVVVSWFSWRK